MAQDRGLVQRGLVLLLFMVALCALVVFMLVRRDNQPPEQTASDHQEMAVLIAPSIVPSIGVGFPANVHWPALVKLSEKLPSSLGWQIRYNAAIALARYGSSDVPFNILSDMLDEQLQMRNFRVKLADGKDAADEAAARRTVLNALKAVVEWHKVQHSRRWRDKDAPQLRRLYAAIDRLTRCSNTVLKEEAEKTKKEIGIK
jgi:hypothetical protein